MNSTGKAAFYLGLPGLALALAACEARPGYGPVSPGVMARLEKKSRAPSDLGVISIGGRMFFRSDLKAPDEMRVKFETDSGIPRIGCRLNGGGPVKMMLDTGSQRTVLDGAVAAANGVDVIKVTEADFTLAGIAGNEKAMVGMLSPLSFANATVDHYPCLIRTHHNQVHHGPFWTRSIELNLLGFDLPLRLCRYLTVDYAREELVFGFRSDYAPAGKVVRSAPLVIRAGLPWVKLKAGAVEWNAVVDTGSSFGVEVHEELAKKLRILEGARAIRSGLINAAIGGTVEARDAGVRIARLEALEGLGPVHRDAEVAISPGIPRVGSHFLRDYRVTFDLKRKRLWLEQ